MKSSPLNASNSQRTSLFTAIKSALGGRETPSSSSFTTFPVIGYQHHSIVRHQEPPAAHFSVDHPSAINTFNTYSSSIYSNSTYNSHCSSPTFYTKYQTYGFKEDLNMSFKLIKAEVLTPEVVEARLKAVDQRAALIEDRQMDEGLRSMGL